MLWALIIDCSTPSDKDVKYLATGASDVCERRIFLGLLDGSLRRNHSLLERLAACRFRLLDAEIHSTVM